VTDPSLALAIPLYDEEGNVERVASELLETFRTAEVPLTLLLVDNGSRDGTRSIVQRIERQEPEVTGVYLDVNAGYGGGILAGMREAEADIIGYMWGDAQVGAEDVIRVYRRLVVDGADLAKARRIQRNDGWQRRLVTKVYNTVTLTLFHVTSSDANGCPKLFRKEAWEQLTPSSTDWFLDPEIMIGAAQLGLKKSEVDVVARPRTAGKSKVGGATVVEFLVNLTRAKMGG